MLPLLVLLLLLTSCATARIEALANALNERQVQSCIYVTGAYGLFLSVRLVSATGGQDLRECLLR